MEYTILLVSATNFPDVQLVITQPSERMAKDYIKKLISSKSNRQFLYAVFEDGEQIIVSRDTEAVLS